MAVLETKPLGVERSAEAGGRSPDPDAGTLHCYECRSPLAADQACCLECGAPVRDPRRLRRWLSARWPLRTGLATAVGLVLSASVGLAASVASQGGGNPPPQAFAGGNTRGQVPLATTPTTDGSSSPTPPPPSPTSGSGSTQTSSAPTPAPKSPTTTAPTTPNTSSGGTSGTTPSGSPAKATSSANSPFEPFGGDQPSGAGSFGAGTQSGHPASDAIDQDESTYWLTNEAGSGIWISTGGSQYSRIGVQPASGHTGFVVQVYGSNTKPTAGNVTDGTLIGSKHTIDGATKLKLAGTSFQYYSLYIVQTASQSADAGIAELSLIP